MKKTIVFYDGSCRMCVGVSGWLTSIDHKEQFELIPFQNSAYLQRYPTIKPQDLNHALHLIDESGTIKKGANAVLEIWKKLNHWSSFIATFFQLPPMIWFADVIYWIVARIRKKIY